MDNWNQMSEEFSEHASLASSGGPVRHQADQRQLHATLAQAVGLRMIAEAINNVSLVDDRTLDGIRAEVGGIGRAIADIGREMSFNRRDAR